MHHVSAGAANFSVPMVFVPVLRMNSGESFLYHPALQTWTAVNPLPPRTLALSHFPSPYLAEAPLGTSSSGWNGTSKSTALTSAVSSASAVDSILSRLQPPWNPSLTDTTVKPSALWSGAVRVQTAATPGERMQASLIHAETQVGVALTLGSAVDYKMWLLCYVKYLVEGLSGNEAAPLLLKRLEEVCAFLLGPISQPHTHIADVNSSQTPSTGTSCILGMRRHDLLDAVLASMRGCSATKVMASTFAGAL
jgi:hypothetical protein